MELLDVLNESGEKTGEIFDRELVHQKGLWHKEIVVWVINSKGQVLIQRRSPDKTIHPNLLGLCAGHVTSGDNSIDTAQKELFEEIGLNKNKDEIHFLTTQKKERYFDNGLINRIFNDVYYVFSDQNISDFKIQKEELSEVKWMNYQDLKKRILSNDPEIALNPIPENLRMLQLLDKIIVKQTAAIKHQ